MIEFKKYLLDKYKSLPGYSLYSDLTTLKRGDYYIMGLNPGGDSSPTTIEEHINSLGNTFNVYEDDAWKPGDSIGKKLHIKRVKRIAELLDKNIRDIFSCNAIFARSISADQLKDIDVMFNDFWNFHKYFLSIVRPKVIICLGNGSKSSYSLLKTKRLNSVEDNFYKNLSFKNGKYYNAVFDIDNGDKLNTIVAGIPHPSRYAFDEDFIKFLK